MVSRPEEVIAQQQQTRLGKNMEPSATAVEVEGVVERGRRWGMGEEEVRGKRSTRKQGWV